MTQLLWKENWSSHCLLSCLTSWIPSPIREVGRDLLLLIGQLRTKWKEPYKCKWIPTQFIWSCFKIPAEEAAKHNCSLLRNTNVRAELPFTCFSTPEQVRAAPSASLKDFTPCQHTSQPVGTTGRIFLAVDQHQQGQIPPCAPHGSVWHSENLRTCRVPQYVSSPMPKHSGLGSWTPEASWNTPPRSTVGTFPLLLPQYKLKPCNLNQFHHFMFKLSAFWGRRTTSCIL